jgi:hypothetical protein
MIRAPVMAVGRLLPQMGNSMLFLLSFKSGRGNSGIGGLIVVVELLDKIKGFICFCRRNYCCLSVRFSNTATSLSFISLVPIVARSAPS